MEKKFTLQDSPGFRSTSIKAAVMLMMVVVVCAIVYSISVKTGEATENTARTAQAVEKRMLSGASRSKAVTDSLVRSDWYGDVMRSIEKAEYRFTMIDSSGQYSSPNRKNNMRFYYDENGFSAEPRTTKIPVGKPDPKKQPHEREFKTIADWKVEFLLDKKQVGQGRWSVQDHQAEYITDNITVQYLNNEDGMRQNFIVNKPLAGSEELKINFTVKTTLKQQFSSDRLSFVHPREGTVLSYDGLKVWDAEGKALAARFEKTEHEYSIHVNTLDATYPVTIDPLSSDPSAFIESNQENAQLGYSVDGAGDVNNDGFDDMIVGAPFYDSGQEDEGAVFIFYGAVEGVNTTVGAPSIQSNQAGALAGYSVSGAGDVNGDGYDDVIIGLPYFEIDQTKEGLAWVLHGSGAGLNTVDVVGIQFNQANAQLGWSVDGAGDVNGDGFDDVIVGAPNFDNAGADKGLIFVGHGSAGGNINNGFVYYGAQVGGKLGWSVAGIGDFNGDGFADVGAGAPFLDLSVSILDVGYFIWFPGSSTGVKTSNNHTFGEEANGQLGYSIASAGDINGDGFDEIMVGAPFNNSDDSIEDAGQVIIWYGTSNFPGTSSICNGDQANAHFGMSLASLGDMNGDGYEDILIGAPDYDNGQENEGAAFLYKGSSEGLQLTYSHIFESDQADAKFGQSLAGAGDLNGDGDPDFIIGASQYDNGQANEGAVFIYYDLTDPLGLTVSIIARGNQERASLGYSVSGAGDVNGDGYSDVIVGAPGYDNGQTDEGAAFLYYGSAQGLDTALPVMLELNQEESGFGTAVSTAGDVNGDGYSDIIVGADTWTNGEQLEGAAFVFYGAASGINLVPDMLEINQEDANFGAAVACAGDIDGDGFSDVIVGAQLYNGETSDQGAIAVFYGSASGIVVPGSPTIFTYENEEARFGYTVAGAGDVNGDGFSDVIAGAPYHEHGESDEGAARLYYGSASGLNPAPVMLEANVENGLFGSSVAGAGDVNGDGYSDVVVSSPQFGNYGEGAFYLFTGGPSGINTTASRIRFNRISGYFGTSISSAGDLNGDGFADVVVAGNMYPNGEIGEGAAYIYMGSPAGLNSLPAKIIETDPEYALISCVSSAGDVNGDGYSDLIFGYRRLTYPENREGGISMLYGAPDVIDTYYSAKVELNQEDARLGTAVAIADVNGDGFSDVIVGAPQYDFGQDNEGIAIVYLGSANGLSQVPQTLQRNQEASSFGTAIASAGDVNGDGFDDVIIGAPGYNNGQLLEGAAFLYYGSNGGLIGAPVVLEKNQAFSFFGFSVSTAGDVNGDGYDDVLVGSLLFSNGQPSEGAVFLYPGSASGVDPNSAITLEMNQAAARFGSSIASAGDVNGDGFGDVIIGASNYSDGETGEGAAFVFYGSASGLNTTPDRILQVNQTNSSFGSAVAGVGDVDGDGYSDIVVGAPAYADGQHNEGHAFVYYGSATGIGSEPDLVLQGNSPEAYFGSTVARAGDINSDGYSDVIIGAMYYAEDAPNAGAAMIFLGSPTGLTTDAAKLLRSKQLGSLLGMSLAGNGDINGDGFSDIMVGASRYSQGQTDEGIVFVHYGNAANKIKRNSLDLYNTDLVTPVNSSNFGNTQFGAGLFAKSFMGRDKGKLVWETKQNNTAYSGSPHTNSTAFTSQQNSYSDLGVSGIELKNVVNKLPGLYTKIRARVKYNPVTAIKGQLYGPWRYFPQAAFGSSTPLPVDLISFKAVWEQRAQVALVTFTTENETAIDHYEIEKSTNGKNYFRLTEVAADNAPGIRYYSVVDSNATAGRQYYRLRTVHMDGSTDYSRIIVLVNDKKSETILSPNPAVDMVNLKMSSRIGKVSLQVVNSAGQTVKQFTNISVVGERIQVPVSDLPAGIYLLHLQNDGQREVLKFIKR